MPRCVEAGVNFAPSLYGFERDHLSWHWMFWTAAVITPVMMLCIYHGIPAPPRPAGSRTAPPSLGGVFYLSLGFALLYAALDKGQRLEWWRSGVFTPHFHFETLPPNLWIVATINIHAGVSAVKTLWRSVPNG